MASYIIKYKICPFTCVHARMYDTGGSLGLEVGMHVQPQNRVLRKGGVFDRELVTRVTCVGYEILQKLLKGGAFFKSNLEKCTFLDMLANFT
jgi:hypothetical protein